MKKPCLELRPYGTNLMLDACVNSSYWGDRASAAEQGYGLDKLVDDKDFLVRKYVARQNYGLDKLWLDEDKQVRIEAARQIKKSGCVSLPDWIVKNRNRCCVEQNRSSSYHKNNIKESIELNSKTEKSINKQIER